MAIAIALWSAVVQPGKKLKLIPQSDVRITNASLGDKLADETGRTTVKVTYDVPTRDDIDEAVAEGKRPPKTTTVLCSLTPGKIEQSVLDLVFEVDAEYYIEVVGKNTVYLSGNYIEQQSGPMDFDDEDDLKDIDPRMLGLSPPGSDDEYSDDEDEDEDDDVPRIEEISDDIELPSEKVTKKRRASDAMEVEAPESDGKASKKETKKQKKLKDNEGKAIPKESTPAKKDKDGKAESTPGKTPEGKKEKSDKKDAGKLKELPSGLKVKDVTIGTGKAAKAGDMVFMRYIGKLEKDHNKVFDSNTKGKPFKFRLGSGQVIKGWDEGIAGMQVGGERLLIVPPKLAYGNKKAGDDIPANSTLRFECKLVEIK